MVSSDVGESTVYDIKKEKKWNTPLINCTSQVEEQ